MYICSKEISFNEGLISSGAQAFDCCYALTKVELPKSVQEIESDCLPCVEIYDVLFKNQRSD